MTSAPDIRHILVPHDFGDTAEHALSYALALAEKFGARITVVHAYELPTYGYSDAFVASLEAVSEVERAATASLEAVKARVAGAKAEIALSLRRGNPWSEITAAAEETSADLIVIGTHGRRGLARALLGSVAEKVVRTAPCPVLTVHSPQGERARAASPEPA